MHPKEMSHMALVAASAARQDGFQATADALLALAVACDDEARRASQLNQLLPSNQSDHPSPSHQDLLFLFH